MNTNAKPYHLSRSDRSENKRAYWYRDILWIMLATEEDTAGQYSLMEQLCPQGSGAATHLHEWQDESFYILEGEATFTVGEQTIQVSAGSFVNVPRQTPHSFHVDSAIARVLNHYVPAGFEQIILGVAVPATALALPPEDLLPPNSKKEKELQQKYGLQLL